MSEAQHLAEALEGLFANPENGWFTPFSVATAGLTAEQAAHVPAERFNSVWAVANHVRFCQEVALRRLRGLPVDRAALGAEDDWPPVGEPADEDAWQTARERALAVNRELAETVAGLSGEELAQPFAAGRAARYQLVQGLIAHSGYHACEIISIRHMQGLWLERT
jgi:hypothetical protein